MLVGIVVATLAVLVVVFTVVGIDKNHQIDQLHNQGVAVNVTITSCQGLLGGSGSNGAGYACRGTYVLDGHRYNEQLPGTALHAPGTVIRAIAVPGDPALVSPVSVVRHRALVGDRLHPPGRPARRAGRRPHCGAAAATREAGGAEVRLIDAALAPPSSGGRATQAGMTQVGGV